MICVGLLPIVNYGNPGNFFRDTSPHEGWRGSWHGFILPSRALNIHHSPLEIRYATRENESLGGLSCLSLGDVFGLRTFLALDDFKLNVITFLQALVAFRLDGAVVDEHIGAVFPADKAEALRVVKPFHFTFDSRHDPYSELSGKKFYLDCFFLWASKFD